jgi:hypothetical protein
MCSPLLIQLITKEIDNGKEIGEPSSNIVNKSVLNNSKDFTTH